MKVDNFGDFVNSLVYDVKPVVKLPYFLGIDLFSISKHIFAIWFIIIFLLVLVLFLMRACVIYNKTGVLSSSVFLCKTLIDFIENNIVIPNFGKVYNKKYLGLFLTIFLYISCSNLFSLVPGFPGITANVILNFYFSIFLFIFSSIFSIFRFGFISYFTNMIPNGIPLLLQPLVLIIEFISLFSKPFSLSIRLFANMLSGTIMVVVLMWLISRLYGGFIQLPIGILGSMFVVMIFLLKIFVCLFQAYVFTLLSSIMISSIVLGQH